jgi:hypothetical protein
MKETEEYYIDYYNAYNSEMFYNATKYSSGLTKFPENKKINISKANRGHKYNLGKKHSNETKQKMSEIKIGKILTQEHKNKIGDSKKNNNYALGYKFTTEQKSKISEGKSKSIIQYTKEGIFIKEWKSTTEASEYLKAYDSSAICNCLKGKSKTSFGFIWKFKNN